MRKLILNTLQGLWLSIGIDKPNNEDAIIEFIEIDMLSSADAENYTSEDVRIGLRRFIEHSTQ